MHTCAYFFQIKYVYTYMKGKKKKNTYILISAVNNEYHLALRQKKIPKPLLFHL